LHTLLLMLKCSRERGSRVWLPVLVIASIFRGLVASNHHHRSFGVKGNLRTHQFHDASSLGDQNHSSSLGIPGDNCFTPLAAGYQLHSNGHNDISTKLGGRKLVKSIPECRQHCLKYDCASLEVHDETVVGAAGQPATSSWACWLSSTRANSYMGGKLETTKTDGWYYQEVKYCCKPADKAAADKLAAEHASADQAAADKVAAKKAAVATAIEEHVAAVKAAAKKAAADKAKAAADKAAAEKALADRLAADKVAAANRVAADKALADKAAADKAAADKAAADKAIADKAAAAKAVACSIKKGDTVKLMSDRKKLDKAYEECGVARMLSPGSSGTISRIDLKGQTKNVVLLKRQGRDYWVPVNALAGFEKCDKILIPEA